MSTIATETDALWFGESFAEIRVSAADGDGDVSIVETTTPHGAMPPLRVHDEDQSFYVLDGEVTFFVGDEVVRAAAVDVIVAPRGAPHTYRVESEQARWLTVSAHGDWERLVRSFSRPAATSDLPAPAGRPTPEQAAALAAACLEHRIELVGPPLA